MLLAIGSMSSEVAEWSNDDECKMMLSILKDLKAVNDLAQRCIKDIQEYTDFPHRDNMLLVVSDHRGVFQDLRKQSL